MSNALTQTSMYTVASGACISPNQYLCALEKIQCAEGYNFVSAGELEKNYQNSPAIQCLDSANAVPVGQCTQGVDKGICTGHYSNCEACFDSDGICYQPNVEGCSLQPENQRDGSLNFATFGLCVNPDLPDTNRHCLWSRDECPSNDVWVTPNTWITDSMTVDDFCTCDRVQIGACVKDDNFMCAVSPDACGSDEQYIGAKALTEREIDCRLCNEFGLPKDAALNLKLPERPAQPAIQQISRYSTASGACVNDKEYVCALESTQCADGFTFLSARQLEVQFQNTPVIQCLAEADNVPMGQCTQDRDNQICTGHFSNCEGCFETEEVCFQANVEKCAMQPKDQGDGSINFATFGLCVNPNLPDTNRHCVWSRNECPSSDVWITPNTWLDSEELTVNDFCTCDRVQIGACRYNDQFICAVSPDACGAGGSYIGAKDLTEQRPDVDCRLCNNFDIPKDVALTLKRPDAPKNVAPKSAGVSGGTIALICISVISTLVALGAVIYKVEKKAKTEVDPLVVDLDGNSRMPDPVNTGGLANLKRKVHNAVMS
mmetsp:Transcript_30774/g.46671  ORF Transcript_30774/g.46671 Transcript_30774/m.46671 type:complete len:545 (+) Transcript_30774:62-1696(+)|eukprot:CAMPEP_0178906912 /NCGR_PEP_ID=MMETSP0786-20121207/7078_1 /TAXON_ID=186022 /ORGANISM="Thalassionema frauenfeldii, Strain CCMP 1798" /LENGTH=544 /DNA_ID=CAMNT_0020578651 /DNA_START=51 /DNA_END=1685 /DNA_ORIENTATION=-